MAVSGSSLPRAVSPASPAATQSTPPGGAIRPSGAPQNASASQNAPTAPNASQGGTPPAGVPPRAAAGATPPLHAAELVRTAHVVSAQQKAIFKVIRNLALVNGAVAAALIAYAYAIGLPTSEFIPLTLIAVLATVPVALPATFTLATALGAQALAGRGVLPTRLSAVDEAASMDLLCSDKTGTLTRNELAVAEEKRDHWHLIRLWNFAREPRAFAIRPPLEAHVALTPTSFLAQLR